MTDEGDDFKEFKRKAETARKYVDSLGDGFPQNYKEIAFKLLLEKGLGLPESAHTPEKSDKPVTLPSKTSLAGFIRKLTLKSHSDTTLAIAYYLHKQGIETFNVADIETGYTSAREKKSSNTSQMISENIKKGYIDRSGDKDGKKAFMLLQDGIDFIEKLVEGG